MASGVGGGWGRLEWGWGAVWPGGVCHGGGMLRSDVDPIWA